MAQVLLFHHALGLTEGVLAVADRLRTAGHDVLAPDLFAGLTFTEVEAGVAHAQAIGFDVVTERGVAASAAVGSNAVYMGLSLGVMPAHRLAQSRPGARAAVFLHSCLPPAQFGSTWPADVPVQIHVMADDAWGDVDVARGFADTVTGAELFLYPGRGHLFTDPTSPDYDRAAAQIVLKRVTDLLAACC